MVPIVSLQLTSILCLATYTYDSVLLNNIQLF